MALQVMLPFCASSKPTVLVKPACKFWLVKVLLLNLPLSNLGYTNMLLRKCLLWGL